MTRARVLRLFADEGFDLVRIAAPDVLTAALAAARRAHEEGRLDGLRWMTPDWLARATDPEAFLPGCRAVVLAALPARPPDPADRDDGRARGRVARYAWGRDYHRVFEKRLRRIAARIRDEFAAGARATVDYGPLLERPLAAAAGMGWLGKSTMLLVPGAGPWTLLGAVATTLDLEPDPPLRKTCGSCTRCVAACPTGALGPDGALDARLCISYHTIENRGPIPVELRERFGDWVFGCDACLDACPVGAARFASHPEFEASDLEAARPDLAGLLALDDAAFAARFRGRSVTRAKRDGLLRNACVALGNVGTEADVPALERALDDGSALVRGHAAWALGRVSSRSGVEVRAALERRRVTEDDAFVKEEIARALGA